MVYFSCSNALLLIQLKWETTLLFIIFVKDNLKKLFKYLSVNKLRN